MFKVNNKHTKTTSMTLFLTSNIFQHDHINSLVITQKGESCVSRKQSMSNFPKSEHFLLPDANVGFSENLTCFVLLKHPF